ncbi:MAG: energy transducer TonB [Agarilytica sp.]
MATATADTFANGQPGVQQADSGDRLSFTLFVAVAVHAILIFGITFKLDSGNKIAPTLNITLATHDTKVTPEKADFLAQYNQQASGTAEQVKELTVQERAELQDTQIRDISYAPQEKAQKESLAEKHLITTKNTSTHTIADDSKTNRENQTKKEKEGDILNTPLLDPEFSSLQAKLDKLKQDLARQPRIRRLTSVSTKASHDAAYLNGWAQKVEAVGNKNFPEAALRERIFGNLRLSVMLLPNGRVENIEILQSSGHGILDEAALQIVKLASPFPSFPREVRLNTDKLEIIRTWRFEITGLSTSR